MCLSGVVCVGGAGMEWNAAEIWRLLGGSWSRLCVVFDWLFVCVGGGGGGGGGSTTGGSTG